MPDQPETQTVTLPVGDWQIIRVGLFELAMKFAAPVVMRLDAALAEPSKPDRTIPRVVVEASDG